MTLSAHLMAWLQEEECRGRTHKTVRVPVRGARRPARGTHRAGAERHPHALMRRGRGRPSPDAVGGGGVGGAGDLTWWGDLVSSVPMETALTTATHWTPERLELIKRTVCPSGLTNDEFALFIEQCKRSGLDPLLKEAFCVPAQAEHGHPRAPHLGDAHEFQPSETGMLARAERFPDFGGVQACAVYGGDEVLIDQGAARWCTASTPASARAPWWARGRGWCATGKLPVVVWISFEGYAQPPRCGPRFRRR